MSNRVFCNAIIEKEVSEELGLPLHIVKKIVATQSEFTKNVIESGTFDSVRWGLLGVFKSKPKEVQIINHLKGMNEDQAREFRKAVRTGKIRFNLWEKDADRTRKTKETDTGDGA